MRTLILIAAISVAALMAGPQAASAQNEGRAYQRVSPGPPGGGQFLPSPTRSKALGTTGRGGASRSARRPARQPVPAGPPGGGQFLPPQTR
jgi:hypothetical protein